MNQTLDEIYGPAFVALFEPLRPDYDIMARSLVDMFPMELTVDVGCGPGLLINAMNSGYGAIVLGIEGSRHCLMAAPKSVQPYLHYQDIRTLEALPPGTTLVVSTEVAEHLDEKDADHFVALLCSAKAPVVLTAAPPGQPGCHHVNCQPQEYWLTKFAAHDFMLDLRATDKLRAEWEPIWRQPWLAANVMVLRPS